MAEVDDPTAPVPIEGILAYRRGAPAETSQLDFLLGVWDARTTRFRADGTAIGGYAGTWRARYLHERRILLDELTVRLADGSEVSYMATLRTFSPLTQQWEMTSLIAHQRPRSTSLSGSFEEGEMRFRGEGKTLDGRPLLAQVRFFGITASRFEWESRVSLDGGATWYRDSAIHCERAQ